MTYVQIFLIVIRVFKLRKPLFPSCIVQTTPTCATFAVALPGGLALVRLQAGPFVGDWQRRGECGFSWRHGWHNSRHGLRFGRGVLIPSCCLRGPRLQTIAFAGGDNSGCMSLLVGVLAVFSRPTD